MSLRTFLTPSLMSTPKVDQTTASQAPDGVKVQRIEQGLNGKLFITQRGQEIARIIYQLTPDLKNIVILHTIVDPEFRGHDLGMKLVLDAVAYARETGKKIVPICWYARQVLTSDAQFADVLAPMEG
jgi:uncharacterized protein